MKIYQQFANYYDKIYGNKMYRKFADFIWNVIDDYGIKNPSILDMACGTGRLIKELGKKRKIRIVGCDASETMIHIARKRNRGVPFYIQDFTELNLRRKFSIITSTFNSINYLLKKEDLNTAFGNISHHLEKSGIFIFDFNTPNLGKMLPKELVKARDSVFFANNIRNNRWYIDIKLKKGKKTFHEYHLTRFYALHEIKSLLIRNKFVLRGVYTIYSKDWCSNIYKSPRLIIVAQLWLS